MTGQQVDWPVKSTKSFDVSEQQHTQLGLITSSSNVDWLRQHQECSSACTAIGANLPTTLQ